MDILCKKCDVDITVAAFYYVAKFKKDFQGQILVFLLFLKND